LGKASNKVSKHTGRINGWFEGRGFGFIHENQDGRLVKLFLHVSNILSGAPRDGAEVLFNVGNNTKGLMALDVEIAAPRTQPVTTPEYIVGLDVLAGKKVPE
jgi:cold shock CspA family protein